MIDSSSCKPHELFKTGDSDAPINIMDANGNVVIDLCRVCWQAEGALKGECALAGKVESSQPVESSLGADRTMFEEALDKEFPERHTFLKEFESQINQSVFSEIRRPEPNLLAIKASLKAMVDEKFREFSHGLSGHLHHKPPSDEPTTGFFSDEEKEFFSVFSLDQEEVPREKEFIDRLFAAAFPVGITIVNSDEFTAVQSIFEKIREIERIWAGL